LYRSGKGKNFGDVGVIIQSIKTPFNSEESYKLQLWDLKYNTAIKKVYPQFCEGANCVLIFFDDTNRNSLRNMQNWIEMTIKYADNIPIILIETRSNLTNYVITNEEIDNFFENFRLNRLYFKDFNDYTREKLFRQVIKIIEEYHKCTHFNVLLSNEFKDFKKIDELFSVYQVC
jgi:GTPase SAR1 family protein